MLHVLHDAFQHACLKSVMCYVVIELICEAGASRWLGEAARASSRSKLVVFTTMNLRFIIVRHAQ